jgi:hypothetical protein
MQRQVSNDAVLIPDTLVMTRDSRRFGSVLHKLFERTIEMGKKVDQDETTAAVLNNPSGRSPAAIASAGY